MIMGRTSVSNKATDDARPGPIALPVVPMVAHCAGSSDVETAYDLIKRRGTRRESTVAAHYLAYGRAADVISLAAVVAARTTLRIVA
jgi:hypothetical protein